jgi:hypothetical protein
VWSSWRSRWPGYSKITLCASIEFRHSPGCLRQRPREAFHPINVPRTLHATGSVQKTPHSFVLPTSATIRPAIMCVSAHMVGTNGD